jgi:hypothetical protein
MKKAANFQQGGRFSVYRFPFTVENVVKQQVKETRNASQLH